jgi:hypothetical protein
MVESFVDTMNISGNLSPALYFNNIITKLNKIARNLI